MSLEEELSRFSPNSDTLLAIGVFDGVHLGHKALISELTRMAEEQGLTSGVVTFRQHPQSLLSPEKELPHLTSLSQKIRLLKDEGVEDIITLTFSQELASLSAAAFLSLLKKHLKMRGLVIGTDFALGKNREGNAANLLKLGQAMGFSVTVVPPATVNGQVVSSTTIRNALAAGDIKRVYDMTGRYFRLEGHVITGNGRGANLGFPTANLDIGPEQALPVDGVYATRAYIYDQTCPALTNIGTRPTFGRGQRVVEVYILDYKGDLYGRELTIDIIERLRGEVRFKTAAELKKQIKADIKKGRAILESRKGK